MPTIEERIADAEELWRTGMERLFDEFSDAHMAKMHELGIKYAQDKIYLSPSKASIIIPYNGIPVLEGPCHRQLFFKHFSVPKTREIPIYIKRKMLGGIALEEFEHKIENKGGNLYLVNEPLVYHIDDKTSIIGVVDSVLTDSWGNHYVKEIKHIYGYTAVRNHIKGTKTIRPYPRITSILQIMLYILILGLDYGILKFIDATSLSDDRSYIIELEEVTDLDTVVDYKVIVNGEVNDDITISRIIERYMRYSSYIENKQLPPKDCQIEYDDNTLNQLFEAGRISKTAYKDHISGKKKIGDWQCNNCEWRELCQQPDSEVVQQVQPYIVEKIVPW